MNEFLKGLTLDNRICTSLMNPTSPSSSRVGEETSVPGALGRLKASIPLRISVSKERFIETNHEMYIGIVLGQLICDSKCSAQSTGRQFSLWTTKMSPSQVFPFIQRSFTKASDDIRPPATIYPSASTFHPCKD